MFMKEIKKQRRMVEKRKKRKSDELSNPVRKKIRVKNQSQIQVSSRPPSALSSSSSRDIIGPLATTQIGYFFLSFAILAAPAYASSYCF